MSLEKTLLLGFVAGVTILLGLIFTALGVGALAFLAWPAGLLAGASWGFGFGITIPACNLLVAATTPIERRAAALNLLNFFWSVGAVSCPFLLAPFERSHQVRELPAGDDVVH